MSKEEPEPRNLVQLRRYPNRRYYDAARSQHLTLEEIFRLICEGRSVEVSDSKSGEDITTRVLAQLILEQAPGKWAALPAELLHQLIRANDNLLREFVDKYFHRAMMAFAQSQCEFEKYMRHALGLSQDLLSMNAGPWGASWAGLMFAPFMRTFLASESDAGEDASGNRAPETTDPGREVSRAGSDNRSGLPYNMLAGAARAESDAVSLKSELDELKHQIAELRKELRQR